jgi:hypothetical protein
MPDGYLNQPVLAFGNSFLWDAFWELTTDRQLGFGAESRIPSSAIRAFAQDHDLAGDDFQWFRLVIREMDAEYLGIRAPVAPGEIVNQTAMTDVKGLRSLFRKHAKKPATSEA